MTRFLGLILILAAHLFSNCSGQPVTKAGELKATNHLPVDSITVIDNIAFGSCNKQHKDQPMWPNILQNDPDLWIWLGDNIYGDTEDMEVMKRKYDEQNENTAYQELLAQCPIIGTWDDHDYGINDGGKEYPQRKESKQLFTQFMGYEQEHPIHDHEGVYHSYTFGEKDQTVKIILLDTRYFRDYLVMQNSMYIKNETGTILGEAQWAWLEKELQESKASVHIIASSIQIVPQEHRFEKWANFPNERKRLFGLIDSLQVANPILLSGDRHAAEISRYPLTGEKIVYEVTASGLTHAYTSGGVEPNEFRVGEERVQALNFGLIRFDWETKEASLEIRGLANELFIQKKIKL